MQNQLGKYEVLQELGRGAMGVVFKARDPLIGRVVALKTITIGLGDRADLLGRFYREAQAAGSLQHPNVVTIYEMGEQDGMPYLAMEYLEGESLERIIARRAELSLAEKIGCVVQTCQALDHAHRHNIVHRDIKPANVMVTTGGTVKVVDFGIARLADASKTQTGTVLGTIAYMSPQQLRGQRADARSDIWAVGVVLYELLTFRQPFYGDNPPAVILSIISDEARPTGELVPGLPDDLQRIAHRLLLKDDTQRYQTMEALLLDLEPVWRRLQREEAAGLVAEARKYMQSGEWTEARRLLRRAAHIDTSQAEAWRLLDEVNRSLQGDALKAEIDQHLLEARRLFREGQWQEAKAEAESVLELDTKNPAASRLLEQISAELAQAAAHRTGEVPVILGSPGSSAMPPAARGRRSASSGTVRAAVPAPDSKAAPGRRIPLWRHPATIAAVLFAALALIFLPGYRRFLPAHAATPTSSVPVQPSRVSLPAPAVRSVEEQQRALIAQAHEAADADDYASALARLNQAEKLNGPLQSLIADLRRKFAVEQQDSGARDIARQEREFWAAGSAALAQGRLDQAENAFRKILALPEGGHRREEAQRQIEDVLPQRREEERLYARAQQTAQKGDAASMKQALLLLDTVVAANGSRRGEAQQLQTTLRNRLNALDEKNRGDQQARADTAQRARFAQLESQFQEAQQRGDEAARQQLRDLLPQFRSIADSGGALSANARSYAENTIPAALKDLDAKAAKASGDAAEASRFNDAVAHYQQAVQARDAAALRAKVLPEFQNIAAAGGAKSAEAARYVASVLPAAIRDAAPWPAIGCPTSAVGLGPSIKPGDLVACGLLDPPKLNWIQFVWPEFPARARQAGQPSGTAMLSVTVDENGAVVGVRARGRGDSYGFTDAATAAARQWKTSPPRVHGKPVKTEFAVDVSFTP